MCLSNLQRDVRLHSLIITYNVCNVGCLVGPADESTHYKYKTISSVSWLDMPASNLVYICLYIYIYIYINTDTW